MLDHGEMQFECYEAFQNLIAWMLINFHLFANMVVENVEFMEFIILDLRIPAGIQPAPVKLQLWGSSRRHCSTA